MKTMNKAWYLTVAPSFWLSLRRLLRKLITLWEWMNGTKISLSMVVDA